MRQSYLIFLATLLTAFATANAQITPDRGDLLNSIGSSIGKGGNATGSGVGGNLLDTYKQQLNSGMPCTGGNTQGCATLPEKSGSQTAPSSSSSSGSTTSSSSGSTSSTSSSSSSGGTTSSSSGGTSTSSSSSSGSTTSSSSGGTSTSSSSSSGSTTSSSSGSTSSTSSSSSSGGTTSSSSGGTSTSSSSSSGGTTSSSSGGTSTSSSSSSGGSTSSSSSSSSGGGASNITRDQLLGAMDKAITNRVNKLGADMSTADLAGVIRYVKAMQTILKLFDSPVGKPAIIALLNKLSQTSTAPIMENLDVMKESQRELNVLQVSRREVGSKALADSIDDFRNGGGKMKRAIYKMSERLRSMHGSSKTQEQRDKIRKVMGLLSEHSRKDIPNKVMNAALSPLMVDGKLSKDFSGAKIAQILEVTDDYEPPVDTPGADIVTRAAQ